MEVTSSSGAVGLDDNGDGSGSNGDRDGVDIHHGILAKVWAVSDTKKVLSKVMHRLREKRVGPLPESEVSQQEASEPKKDLSENSSSKATAKTLDTVKQEPVENALFGFDESIDFQDVSDDEVFDPEALDLSLENIFESIERVDDSDDQLQETKKESDNTSNHCKLSIEESFGGNAGVSVDENEVGLNGNTEKISSSNNIPEISSSNNLNETDSKGLDDELNTFLNEFSAFHDLDQPEQLHKLTLQKWIARSKQRYDTDVLGYVKSGLPIAIKLTEFLIQVETELKQNNGQPLTCSIPLASISAANVFVTTKERGMNSSERPIEVMEDVSIISSADGDLNAGGLMPRLVALGLVLYEIFAGEVPEFLDDEPSSDALAMHSITLNNDDDGTPRPSKKSQRPGDIGSKCVARLRYIGMPRSICALVGNLLACSQGDLCGDDAYSSFEDVRLDLQLLMADPPRFLEDIGVNPLPQLIIPDKQYGREEQIKKLENAYFQHTKGNVGGIIISGKGGLGKSKLAMHIQNISKGHFLVAKFDQSQDVYPLATVGSLFNSLCDFFVQNATPDQMRMANEALESALGVQAGVLVGIVPSLAKIQPSCLRLGHSRCINSSMSLQFLFNELSRVISSHSTLNICAFFDDLHWADPISLQLIGSLISGNEGRKSVFFICSYRDNEIDENEMFQQWLGSMSMLSLDAIKLDNLTVKGVNSLLSDTLHLSPRVTNPLSSLIHHKAGGGNPLFLKQIIGSMKEKGYIYVDLGSPKWTWDLDKIMEMKISEDVVEFLIESMQKLTNDQRQGLIIASCIGSSVKRSIINILSNDLKMDLLDILWQVSQKGFMNKFGDGDLLCYSFTHDKIQQAAYQLLPEQTRRWNHMRFGLAICSHTMDSSLQNDELFFTSINQINKGGPDALSDSNQRVMVAALNLKAGKRSTELSDISTAFNLFKWGIAFLEDGHWEKNYELSINLHDAVCDAACFTNNVTAVTHHTEQVFSHARTDDDKFNSKYAATKILSHVNQREAIKSIYKILEELGEKPALSLGDPQLISRIVAMNGVIRNTTDETILSIKAAHTKRVVMVMKLYIMLIRILHFVEPSLLASTSHRVIELTLSHGLCFASPVAFAVYGQVLSSIENYELAVRLGGIALKLVEKSEFSLFKSGVFSGVYQYVFWINTPFQMIVDSHLIGHRVGQQCGDVISSTLNLGLSLGTKYVAGHCLDNLRGKYQTIAVKLRSQKIELSFSHLAYAHSQICVLIEGLEWLDQHSCKWEAMYNLPGEMSIIANAKKGNDKLAILQMQKANLLVRTFLFRRFDEASVRETIMTNLFSEKKMHLRTLFLFAIFFEGLISFELARRAEGEEGSKWIAKGEVVLEKMKHWNEQCAWNFENKFLLLSAERKSILGDFDEAASLYARSIKSAHDHKFIHEEAIAAELAGVFFHRLGHSAKSYELLLHSQKCFERWGASAVARRVGTFINSKFGSGFVHFGTGVDDVLASFLSLDKDFTSKRKGHNEIG